MKMARGTCDDAAAVAAFFDIDGTLLPSPSLEWRFIAYLLAHDQIPAGNAGRWMAQAAKTLFKGMRTAILGNKQYLRGLNESLVSEWEQSLDAKGGTPLRFWAAALERISSHSAQGHRVFLVSGTLEPLASVAEQRLTRELGPQGASAICATRAEICDRRFTGRIVGEHMSCEAKARALRELADRHGLALRLSYAYGDSIKDAAMLDAVGHPRAVNPSWRLADLALSRGWEICAWRDALPPNAEDDASKSIFATKEAR